MTDLRLVGDQFVCNNPALNRVSKANFAAFRQVLLPNLFFFIDNAEPALGPVRPYGDVNFDRLALHLLAICEIAPGKSHRAHGRAG